MKGAQLPSRPRRVGAAESGPTSDVESEAPVAAGLAVTGESSMLMRSAYQAIDPSSGIGPGRWHEASKIGSQVGSQMHGVGGLQ